ncbi:hypothetical protein BH18ACT10_BH18ACT10_09020 [soil metagenome]
MRNFRNVCRGEVHCIVMTVMVVAIYVFFAQ